MAEPKKEELLLLKRGESKCPNLQCTQTVYESVPTDQKDDQGRVIMMCTTCFRGYVVEA